MTKAPDPGFAFWSPSSCRAIGEAEQLAELRRESERRHASFHKKVETGAMTPLEAAHGTAIVDALVYDFQLGPPPRKDGFTWAQKINAMRGEIMRRRNNLPHLARQSEIVRIEAERHLSVLECAHARYWGWFGLNFMDGAGEPDHARLYTNLRAEIARRFLWAIGHGRDPAAADTDLLEINDWSTVPPLARDRAAIAAKAHGFLYFLEPADIDARLATIFNKEAA
jgi:hypothetical protein